MTAEAREEAFHLSGYEAVASEELAHGATILTVTVYLMVDGQPANSGLCVFREKKTIASQLKQGIVHMLARAVAQYLTVGGDANSLLEVTSLLSTLPHPVWPEERVSVLASSDGPMLILRRADDGKYVRVVYGSEGFTEILSEQELIDSFGNAEG